MKVLNLYAGVGGNRKLWNGCDVTAIEYDERIAGVYQKLYPDDKVVIGDAHQYLLDHSDEFDFIWTSPPCQTHSRMMKATRHRRRAYPNMSLYQQIIFLQHFFKGKWVVENVKPYYTPLIDPDAVVGRHYFWGNVDMTGVEDVKRPSGFITKSNLAGREALMDWLGIHFDEVIYYDGNHCPCQVLRNCVHPNLGKQIFDRITLDNQQ